MSALDVIAKAIAKTVDDNIADELFCYDHVAETGHLPALLLEPDGSDFAKAFGRGLDEWWFNGFILVSRNDMAVATQQLNGLITGSGPNSIRRILHENSDVGLDDTQVIPRGIRGYGGQFEWASVAHVGAIMRLQVITDGRN